MRIGLGRISDVAPGELSDDEVIASVRRGEIETFEVIMRRYNQRLYRTVYGILGTDSETEDVIQDAYVRAYTHLDQFAGRASFSTWLVRIAIHEALRRARRRRREGSLEATPAAEYDESSTNTVTDPEGVTLAREIEGRLEVAVKSLPTIYRVAFLLREVEKLSTDETASCLGISREVVKVRLHRARAMLREALRAYEDFDFSCCAGLFVFYVPRCHRVVESVLARLSVTSGRTNRGFLRRLFSRS